MATTTTTSNNDDDNTVTILNELLDLKSKILKAYNDDKNNNSNINRDRIKDILIILNNINITSILITKSKLGNTISSIRTDYNKIINNTNDDNDREIEQLCKALLLKWKGIMDSSTSSSNSSSKKGGGGSTSSSNDKKIPSSVSSVSLSAVKGSSSSSRSSSPLPSTNVLSSLSDNRIKIVNAIKDVFTTTTTTTNTTTTTTKATDVAISIENAVHNLHPNDFKQYRSKVMSLIFNLKKNEKLRVQVYNGTISAKVLVTLTVKELADDKLKEERHHIQENESSSKRLDWNEEHREQMFGELGLDSTIKWEYEEDDYSDPGD